LQMEQAVMVSLWRGDEEYVFPARVVGNGTTRVRVRWELTTREQQMALVQCTFVRADAWVGWTDGRKPDRPLSSLRKVLFTGVEGYERIAAYWRPVNMPFMPLVNKTVGLAHWFASLLPRRPKLILNDTMSETDYAAHTAGKI
ncbi:MAG: hypothetical protein ACHP7O_12765, partial [Burkholderiales bacterium]